MPRGQARGQRFGSPDLRPDQAREGSELTAAPVPEVGDHTEEGRHRQECRSAVLDPEQPPYPYGTLTLGPRAFAIEPSGDEPAERHAQVAEVVWPTHAPRQVQERLGPG
jgi:hypothetical protein